MFVRNPIASLNNWKKTAVAKPAAPSYQEAVKVFDKDVSKLQSLDKDSFSPRVGINQDIDTRPGEVQVPGVGSLQSTPEGYSVRLIQKGHNAMGHLWMNCKTPGSRAYQVNNETGTITVTNTVGATTSHGPGGSQILPGYSERYTLDTQSGKLKDYRKSSTPTWKDGKTGGAVEAAGLGYLIAH